MMDYKDEFILLRRLVDAENLLKKCLPFIKTWSETSAAGMGYGAMVLMKDIMEYLEDAK